MRLIDHITYRSPGASDCIVLVDGRVVRACQIARGGPDGYAVVAYQQGGVLMNEIVWGHVEIHPDWRVYVQDRPNAPFFDLHRHLHGLPQEDPAPFVLEPEAPVEAPTLEAEPVGDGAELVLRMKPVPAGPDRSLDRWKWRVIRRDGLLPVSQDDPHPLFPERGTSSDFTLMPKHGGEPEKVAAVVLEPARPGEDRVVLEVHPGEQPRRFNRRYFDGSGQAVGTAWCLGLEAGPEFGAAHDDVEILNQTTFWAFFRPDGSVILSTDPEASECGLGMKDAMFRASLKIGEDPITWTAANRDFKVSVEAVS